MQLVSRLAYKLDNLTRTEVFRRVVIPVETLLSTANDVEREQKLKPLVRMKRFYCDRRASASLNREQRGWNDPIFETYKEPRKWIASSLSWALEFRELVGSNGRMENRIIGHNNRPTWISTVRFTYPEIYLRLENPSQVRRRWRISWQIWLVAT